MSTRGPDLSTQKRISAVALLLSASLIVSRMLGFVRDAVISYRMGAGAETDAYHAAFFLPDLFQYFLAGGALSITFIPLFSRRLAAGEQADGWKLFSTIVSVLGSLLAASLVAAWVLAPMLIEAWYVDFSPEQVERTVALTRIVLPGPLFFLVGGLLNATEMAADRFTAAALGPLVYNLCIIFGGLLLEPFVGAAGFSWGALVGVVLGPFLIPLLYARRDVVFSWRFEPTDTDMRRYLALAFPLMAGVTLIFFDERLCQRYAGTEGAITWLNNARRLLLVPVGIIGQSIGQAALPFLARLNAESKHDVFEDTLSNTVRASAALSSFAAMALGAAALPIVALVFGRGAYTATDVAQTGAVLAILAAALPAWSVQAVALRGFYAREQMWPPMILGSVIVALTWPLYPTLSARFGVTGVATASAIALSINALSIVVLYRVMHGGPVLTRGLRGLLEGALAAAAPTALCVWGFNRIETFETQPAILFAAMAAAYALLGLPILLAVGGPAAAAVRRKLSRVFRR